MEKCYLCHKITIGCGAGVGKVKKSFERIVVFLPENL